MTQPQQVFDFMSFDPSVLDAPSAMNFWSKYLASGFRALGKSTLLDIIISNHFRPPPKFAPLPPSVLSLNFGLLTPARRVSDLLLWRWNEMPPGASIAPQR